MPSILNPHKSEADGDYTFIGAKSIHWCPTLCKAMDCSPPGSSIHGIHLVRIPEWVAISFSRGSSQHFLDWFFTTGTTWEAHAVY